MKTKISRQCACGCGGITNPGSRYIWGHNGYWKGKHHTKESRRKMSLSHEGVKLSEEHIKQQSLARFKCNLNRQYCDEWYDKEYRDDLRKDYCENVDCKGKYRKLNNHHINLNKKDCRPRNVMTLCYPCHCSLHNKLGLDASHKDYLTIIRKDHITYVHIKTRKIIATIRRKEES